MVLDGTLYNATGLGALIAPTPLFQVLADDSGGMTPGWMRDFSRSTLDKQQRMVEGFVGSGEQWDADPARAAGSLFVNVGSLLIPVGGEVAAGAKVVSVGVRVVAVGDRVAEAADAASVAGRVAGAGARVTVAAGTGLVRVGDLLTQAMAKADAVGHAATGGAVQALRDAIGRVPSVRVVVEHAVTPDGFRVPAGVRVEVESRVRSQVADAAGQGVLERGTVEAPAGARGAVGSGHAAAGESAVGRGVAVDAVRGVEQHGAETAVGGRHVASTDVREHPGGLRPGDDVRGGSEHGGGHGGHETGHGDHRDASAGHDHENQGHDGRHLDEGAGHSDGHDPSHEGGSEHVRPESGYSIPDMVHSAAPRGPEVDDYWRPLSHEEIQDLPVVRDGSHLNANGSLRPNIWYQTGEHEYLYRTDEHGHIDRVIAENLQLKTHIGRLRHIRRTLGKLFGDHAGHVIADWFGGSPKLDNLVSQLAKINQHEIGSLEKQWARVLKSDPPGHVSLDVRLDTDPLTGRPARFVVMHVIDGQEEIAYFHQ